MKTDTDERLVSVDAFRGIIIARMMIGIPLVPAVQSLPQGIVKDTINSQLYHSSWHGLTWVDFSFAGFIMLMGLSVRLSLKRYRYDTTIRTEFYSKVIRRSLILFMLGFIYNGGFSNIWPDIRLCGILQRMAICYLLASIIYIHTEIRGRCFLLIVLLLVYWGIMALVPFPGGDAGEFSFNKNLAAWIDSQIIPGRLFYNTWDPEGVLSTLPAVASAIVGVLWGDLLLSDKKQTVKALWLFMGGLIAINIGTVWDLVFPINKPLWTSSYVMVTAGIGSILLGGCFLICEVFQQKKLLFPFVVAGRNLLVAFMIMRFIPLDGIALVLTGGDVSILLGATAPFVTAFVETALLWFFLLFLYRNKIAIRI